MVERRGARPNKPNDRRGSKQDGPGGPEGRGLRRSHRKKVCIFCVEKGRPERVDYKDVEFVRRFISDRGRILPRNHTGCCAEHQRIVAQAVKRSRQIGLIPFVID